MSIQESSENLFHFTKKFETLNSIISNRVLWINYCLEDFSWLSKDDYAIFDEDATGNEELKVAIPMTCFCDIPESRMKKHAQVYGNYGIAFSKKWGRLKGINPLLYVYEGSNIYIYLKLLTKEMSAKGNLSFTFTSFLGYCKPYQGDFKNKMNYNFYEEREWRYSPPMTMRKDLTEDQYRNLTSTRYHLDLNFDLSEVELVLLQDELEVKLFEEKYPLLIGKIRAL